MATDGWSGWWVLGAAALGTYAGYKLIPAHRREKETEQLIKICDNLLEKVEEAEDPQLLIDILKIKSDIEEYRSIKGISDSDQGSEDTEQASSSMLEELSEKLSKITKKLLRKKKEKEAAA